MYETCLELMLDNGCQAKQTHNIYEWGMARHRRPFIMLNKMCTPYFNMRLGLHTRVKSYAPKTCALGMCNYFFPMYSHFMNYNLPHVIYFVN